MGFLKRSLTSLRRILRFLLYVLIFQVVLSIFLVLSPDAQRALIFLNTLVPGRVNGISKNLEPPSNYGLWSPLSLESETGSLKISTEDGETLGAWFISNPPDHANKQETRSTPSIVFLYCHGNAGSRAMSNRRKLYQYMLSLHPDAHILAFDYRGFGDSTGSPTQDGLLKDTRAAWNWLVNTRSIPPERIILVGQSLGTAVSHMFLSKEPGIHPRATVLLSPLVSIPDTAYHYIWAKLFLFPFPLMLFFDCDTMSNILREYIEDDFDVPKIVSQHYNSGIGHSAFGLGTREAPKLSKDHNTTIDFMPLVYVHGTSDLLVPYSHGKRLYQSELAQRQKADIKVTSLENMLVKNSEYPPESPSSHLIVHPLEKIAFITMRGYGHNDVNYDPLTFSVIKHALESFKVL
jgi:pimeloyl-ACP methyl ester carboxylesterase